jgi:hypothetical protein
MAKTLKFEKSKAGSADAIREETSRGTGFGNMLWIKDGDSKTIRILAEPKDWEKYRFVRYEELKAKGKLPTYAGWESDYPEVAESVGNPRTAHVIPVATVDDKGKLDRFYFWEPSNKILKDLLAHYDRRKTVMDRDWDIVREGKNLDTTYTLIPDDPSDHSKKEYGSIEELDFDDELVRMVEEFAAAHAKFTGEEPEEDEDERPAKKKPSKKGRVVEDDDDPEEEEEPEEEPEEEGDDDGEIDLDELDFDELKALAKKLKVKVKAGSKSAGYRKALAAHFEAEAEENEEEEEEESDGDDGSSAGGEDGLSGQFVITDIDLRAFTATLVDKEGEAREVYFDRQKHDLDELEDDQKIEVTIEVDPDEDWIVTSDIELVKAKKKK